MKLKKLVKKYCQSHDICQAYADQLRRALRCYVAFLGRDPGKFSYKHLNEFLSDLTDKCSPITVINYRRNLLTIWFHGAELGICETPMPRRVRKPKHAMPAPKAFSVADVRTLIEVAGELRGKYAHCTRASYWKAVIAAGYCTGLRRGDLLQLPRSIENGERFSVVESKTGQTQIRQLSEQACRLLRYVPDTGRPAYGWDHSISCFSRTFDQIVSTAGLVGTFKYLRRSFVTYSGWRHSDPSVSRKHYIDPLLVDEPVPTPPEI